MIRVRAVEVAERLFGEEGGVLADPGMHVVMASAMISVSGVFLVSPIVSALSGPLAVTDARAGQVVTVYTAPLIVLVPLMGFLADRFGRKTVLLFGLLTFGSAGAAIALVTRIEAVLVLRFVQGIGHAAIIPITVTLIGDLYREERETTAQGLRSASIQVVGLVAPVLAGTLAAVSWRLPFLLYGLALLVAVQVWLSFPTVDPGRSSSFATYLRDLAGSLRTPAVSLVLVSFFVRFFLTYSFFAYVSVLVSAATGRTAIAAGLVVSAFSLTAFCTTTQAGRLADRFDPMVNMIGGFLLLGAGFVVLGRGVSYPTVVGGGLLLGVGGGITAPMQKSLVTRLSPVSVRAGSVSSAYVFQSLGQTVGPLVVGFALGFATIGTTYALVGVAGAALGVSVMAIAYLVAGETDDTGE